MDKLQLCAKAFQKLLEYEYHFIIGRKGKLREFYLNFDKADFHHLSGLHKLKDIAQIQQGKRNKIFDQIISGEITQVLIEKSVYYEQMQGRIFPLTDLEKMLDDKRICIYPRIYLRKSILIGKKKSLWKMKYRSLWDI